MTRRAAVALVGDPVRHSVSPAMHRAAFAQAGLALDYVAVRIRRGHLNSSIDELRMAFLGLNVTRPLKEEVVPLLDRVAPEAARIGSVNTVVFRDGAALGYSTDGPGFLAALERVAPASRRRTLVLGTGGAARAVVAALRSGSDVTVSGRNEGAGRRIAGNLGAQFLTSTPERLAEATANADFLVNATPVGQWPDDTACPVDETVPLRPPLVVMDLVYRPRRTKLLRRAAAAGCATVEGVEMLVEQGVRSFELWTGRSAPVDVMREAAYRAVGSGPTLQPSRLGRP
jgi:shikimate dehydrogenase